VSPDFSPAFATETGINRHRLHIRPPICTRRPARIPARRLALFRRMLPVVNGRECYGGRDQSEFAGRKAHLVELGVRIQEERADHTLLGFRHCGTKVDPNKTLALVPVRKVGLLVQHPPFFFVLSALSLCEHQVEHSFKAAANNRRVVNGRKSI
jgi:hypothetical protein